MINLFLVCVISANVVAFNNDHKTKEEIAINPPVSIGSDAISFSVESVKGQAFNMDVLKDKVVVMNFWTVDADPNTMKIKELNKLAKEYKNEDVVFLAFTKDSDARVKQFLQTTRFKYHLVPQSEDVMEQYGVSLYPTNIVIGKDSKVKYSSKGLKATTLDEISKAIKNQL
jgi:peroxiredoxin